MSEAEIRVMALAAEWQREIDSIKGPRWDRRTSGGKRGSIMERCLTELRAALAAPSVEEGPRPKCRAAGAPSEPGTCFKCGVRLEPSPCACGSSHTGTYCWPCHHKNVSSCAAPHCPEHGAAAAQAWLDEHPPAPATEGGGERCESCSLPMTIHPVRWGSTTGQHECQGRATTLPPSEAHARCPECGHAGHQFTCMEPRADVPDLPCRCPCGTGTKKETP